MGKKLLNVTLVTGVVIAGLNSTASLAQAPDNERQTERRGMAKDGKDMMGMGMMGMGMSRMDQDGDGAISRAEFMQAHEEMFDQMDQDKDGMLSKNEWRSGRDMMNH